MFDRILTQPQLIFYFVFIKLGQTYRWPSLPTYTVEDMHAEAAKIATLPINDNLTFGQIWEKRLRGDLINIEEGVFKHWHSNRIVLLGDAAHKVSNVFLPYQFPPQVLLCMYSAHTFHT